MVDPKQAVAKLEVWARGEGSKLKKGPPAH